MKKARVIRVWKKVKTEGLPPIGVPLIVTIDDMVRMRRELRYPVVYRKSLFSDSYGFYDNGGYEESLLTPEYSPVVAWMEIPEIYMED